MSNKPCVVLGGVGIIKGSINEAGPAFVDIFDEINPWLIEDGFLTNAPFKLINGIIRFGTGHDKTVEIGPIDRRNNELPFTAQVAMLPLRRAPKDEVKQVFLSVVIPALFSIAAKYELPTRGLQAYCQANGLSVPDQQI